MCGHGRRLDEGGRLRGGLTLVPVRRWSSAYGSRDEWTAHASPGLFEGASWFLTPTAETDPACYRLVHSFVAQLGATPVAIDPLAHDRLVALTSHLPHALANARQPGGGVTDRWSRPLVRRRRLAA